MQNTQSAKSNQILEGARKFVNSLPPLTWVVILMIVVFAIIEPTFFDLGNLTNIVRRGSSLWMISTVATMVLISGGLDLSLGSVLTFSGVVLALLLETGVNPASLLSS